LEPTPTKEALPSRWDDPELLADIRSEFEGKFGISIEDYYNKAIQEKRVTAGSSGSYFDERVKYIMTSLNGIVLGTRDVETGDGVRHLVMYFARSKGGDEVGTYPVDVAFEKDGVFTQTSICTLTQEENSLMYEHPRTFSSLDEARVAFNQETGKKMDFSILVRFRDMASSSLPQNGYRGDVPAAYWKYVQKTCLTPGNYIYVSSQDGVKDMGNGYESGFDYSLENMLKLGVPDSGLVPVIVGIYTP